MTANFLALPWPAAAPAVPAIPDAVTAPVQPAAPRPQQETADPGAEASTTVRTPVCDLGSGNDPATLDLGPRSPLWWR
ncbi:hypothetical protein ACFYWP_37065 [Actinacidiphila glaucinigra]|uniref:hypothetical protein n=1 Tax=Actinacidiphila glaucinigra TaxID=235986 RepID=UPI003675B5B7